MSATRRRGGQPGNTNALRHGFYSRTFREIEHDDLDGVAAFDLGSEIDMLRTATRRVFELSEGITNLDQAMKLLSVLAVASHHLSSMLYRQKMLKGSADEEIAEALSGALSDVIKEWKLK